jgi:hypothetical protein
MTNSSANACFVNYQAAEKAAREAAAAIDYSEGKYGNLPMNQSQERTGQYALDSFYREPAWIMMALHRDLRCKELDPTMR